MENGKFFESRGNIYSIYKKDSFNGINFVEDKVSKSFQGVIRGFHGDGKTWKLLTCIYGIIKLVTYNIDSGIKNSYILDGDSQSSRSVLISPRTLNAHQCLSQFCIFHYKLSEYYISPEDQWSVYFNDSEINPEWNTEYEDIISNRDLNAKSLKELKDSVL
jgi:dTDP-4-dehydrorhamnose 3,5-epimerase